MQLKCAARPACDRAWCGMYIARPSQRVNEPIIQVACVVSAANILAFHKRTFLRRFHRWYFMTPYIEQSSHRMFSQRLRLLSNIQDISHLQGFIDVLSSWVSHGYLWYGMMIKLMSTLNILCCFISCAGLKTIKGMIFLYNVIRHAPPYLLM